jgi:hypothetical protein
MYVYPLSSIHNQHIQYCITSWGGALKTNILPLERAQRAILKVANSLPFLNPTQLLYDACKVLTVRQLFILHTVLKQHAIILYNPDTTKKRRGYSLHFTIRI